MNIKSILKGIPLFLLSIFVTLLVMEAYLRFAEIESLSNFEVDSIRGKKLRPNVNMLYLNEGFYMGRANSFGYLGPEYPKKKNPENYRIALMGDSYVESFELFDRHSFRSYIENGLDSMFSGRVEVLNFGRAGFNLRNIYAYYRNFASDFNADNYLIFLNNSDFYDTIPKDLLPKIEILNTKLVIQSISNLGNAYKSYKATQFFRENLVYPKILSNCISLIKGGLAGKIIFGKLYELFHPNKESSNKTIINGEPELQELNKRIIKELSESNQIILVLSEKPTTPIQELLDSCKIKTIEIYSLLNTLKEQGDDPNFWPATKKSGHWNHSAQRRIGDEIVEKMMIYKLVKKNQNCALL